MVVVGVGVLRDFIAEHADAREDIAAWLALTEGARWRNPHELVATFPKAKHVASNKYVFKIRHNRYRLLVSVHFPTETLRILKVGTHAEYDSWDY